MSLRVGLFDSGLGGLTVLRQVQQRYPHSPCLYLGDTARVGASGARPKSVRSPPRWCAGCGLRALMCW